MNENALILTEKIENLRPIRLAIAGCANGRIRYAEALQESKRFKIVALSDSDPLAAKSWARVVGSRTPIFEKFDALLENAKEIEAIFIASHTSLRSEEIEKALLAGKPVLCDLPMTEEIAETDRLFQIATENNVPIFPMLPRRGDSWFTMIKEEIEKGVIGDIQQLRVHWNIPLLQTEETEIRLKESYSSRIDGAGVHAIDICRFWLGEFATLSAKITLMEEKTPRRKPTEDGIATLLLNHETTQSLIHLNLTRSVYPGERYMLIGKHGTLELVMEAGVSSATNNSPKIVLQIADLPQQILKPKQVLFSNFPPPIARIVHWLNLCADSIQFGTQFPITVEDARKTQEVLVAAWISAEEETKISFPLRLLRLNSRK